MEGAQGNAGDMAEVRFATLLANLQDVVAELGPSVIQHLLAGPARAGRSGRSVGQISCAVSVSEFVRRPGVVPRSGMPLSFTSVPPAAGRSSPVGLCCRLPRLVATIGDVRRALAGRLGFPETALDGWSAEIRALTDVAVQRQSLGGEQVVPASVEVANGQAAGEALGEAEDAQAAVAAPAQAAGAALAQADQEHEGHAQELKKTCKRLYCGTWSHTDDAKKKAPESMDKTSFGELLSTTLSSIFTKAAEPPKKAKLNHLLKLSVWEELHKSGKKHYHFPILAESPWYVTSLRRALQAHGVFAHFSAEHDYYWSSIVYLAVPSTMPGGKMEADIDQGPWLSSDHPPVRDVLVDIPRGARLSDKARVRRYLGDVTDVARGSSSLAATDKEFSAFVLDRGLRTQTDLLAWARTQVEKLKALSAEQRAIFIGIEAYCFRNQMDLGRRVGFAWEMADAPQRVALRSQSAWDMLVEACGRDCVCAVEWIPRTEALLKMQCEAYRATWPQSEKPASSFVRHSRELSSRVHRSTRMSSCMGPTPPARVTS